MANYGQPYIGGKQWPSTITITRTPAQSREWSQLVAAYKRGEVDPESPQGRQLRQAGYTFGTTGIKGAKDTGRDILSELEKREERAREANVRKMQQIREIYGQVEKRYSPEGAFMKGYETQLARQKTRDIAAGTQQLVGAGLYGTSIAAGIPKKWEEEVGAPARLKLEDIRMQALTQAQLGKAGFIERIQHPYPEYGLVSSLMRQAYS